MGSRSSFGLLLRVALVVAGTMTSGCGEHESPSGPTAPSPGLTPSSTLLPLQPGAYLMSLTGFGVSFGSDVPLGRAGQPNEVAPCYVFLASDDSSYMTGQVLHPNGGEVING